MPRNLELTWDKSRKRWKKFYKGTQYYFPFGESKSDALGYRLAVEAWGRKKAEVDQLPEHSPGLKRWEVFIAEALVQQRQCEREDTPSNRQRWEFLNGQIKTYQAMIREGIPYPEETGGEGLPLVGMADDDNPPPWEQYRGVGGEAGAEQSIGGNIKRFLERKQHQAEKGERSHGHYDVLRLCLEDFAKFAGAGKAVTTINSPMLAEYRERLEKRIGTATTRKAGAKRTEGERLDKISPHYAKHHLGCVKQFVRWCWKRELIELPRILRSREFSISLPERRIETFTTDEVTRLLKGSSDSTRLYLLLMLNCGMTQQDIADLKQAEVDWTQGRVIRKRSKTVKHKSVPEVAYPLWPETFALLKRHRSKNRTLALTNRNGTPLKTEEITGGKVKKVDNIRSAFNRVQRKLKAEGVAQKPLKLLRKTAASMLGQHPEFGKFAQYFLGHAPQTVADKHYVRPSEEQFSKAVKWLGEQFGMGNGEAK